MADSYLPAGDAELRAWVLNFTNYAGANLAALGLVIGDLSEITTALTNYEAELTALVAAKAAAQAARQAKQTVKAETISAAQVLVRRIQANPAVTNAQREALGITVKKTPAPIPPPASRPVAEVEEVEGLRHLLRLSDSDSGRRAKPPGTQGAEVYMKIVPTGSAAPAGPADMSLLGVNTTTRVERAFAGDDTGKTAYYLFRWVNPRGEGGPWSTMVAATIAA